MKIALMFILLAPLGALPSWAVAPRCAGTDIVVPQWRNRAREQICAAATAALDLLRQVGLTAAGRWAVRPLDRAPGHDGAHLLGQFDARSRGIQLLRSEAAEAAARRRQRAFGVPISRARWQSYVAREVAHAAVAPHFAPDVRHWTATECLAAVVQLSNLPEAERQRFLARHGAVAAFGDAPEVSGRSIA